MLKGVESLVAVSGNPSPMWEYDKKNKINNDCNSHGPIGRV
jgi:hypothetical protein